MRCMAKMTVKGTQPALFFIGVVWATHAELQWYFDPYLAFSILATTSAIKDAPAGPDVPSPRALSDRPNRQLNSLSETYCRNVIYQRERERGPSESDCNTQEYCRQLRGWASECDYGRCECKCVERRGTLHFENVDGKCVPAVPHRSFGQNCSRLEDCEPDTGLVCFGYYCNCQEGYMWYGQSNKCRPIVLMVLAGCHEDKECATEFGENYHCNRSRSMCECKPGYKLDTPSRRCLAMEADNHTTLLPLEGIETVTEISTEQQPVPPTLWSQLEVYQIVGVSLVLLASPACVWVVLQKWIRRRNPVGKSSGRASHSNIGGVDDALTDRRQLDVFVDVPLGGLQSTTNKLAQVTRDKFAVAEDHVLGRGKGGIVYRGQFGDGEVAVKTVNPNCRRVDMYMDQLDQEIEIFKLLPVHENVIKLLAYCDFESLRFLLLEFCELGSLRAFLVDNMFLEAQKLVHSPSVENLVQHIYTYKDLFDFAHQIASGAEFLAGQRVVHGDLACRNVLLDTNRVAKITDFGLARKGLKPWKWSGPEVLMQNKFSIQSDVWSFGVTLWEIFSLGAEPYQGLQYHEAFPCELHQGFHRLARPDLAPVQLYRLMKMCWESELENRIGFTELRAQLIDLLHADTEPPPHASPGVEGGNGYVLYPEPESNI